MLEVKGLTKTYATLPAVNNVSFTLRPYEILGYLGPNGSGKSTTVRMLTGLLEPTTGKVLFQGRNIRDDLAGYKRRLGYVPEEPSLYGYLSGSEYLELVGTLRAMPAPLLRQKIVELLRLFSLHESRHSLISSYSKGMKQRILLAAALLHDPEVLILDEPLSGLDPTTALVLKHLVTALAREGKMVLYCSHVLEVVERVCTRVLILYKGNIVAHDSVERLRELMALPSLEEIFAQLVRQTDAERVASDIVQVMKLQ